MVYPTVKVCLPYPTIALGEEGKERSDQYQKGAIISLLHRLTLFQSYGGLRRIDRGEETLVTNVGARDEGDERTNEAAGTTSTCTISSTASRRLGVGASWSGCHVVGGKG